jgi:hypothetical protein
MSSGNILQCHRDIYYNVIRLYITISSGNILQCHQVIYYNVIRWYTTMPSGDILQCHQVIYYNVISLYITILYFTFLFSLFVFVCEAAQYFRTLTSQYFSIWTGPDQYNVFFRILSEFVFCLRYTITKTYRLTDLDVLSIIYQIVHGTSGQMRVYGPVCHPQNIIWTSASLRSI